MAANKKRSTIGELIENFVGDLVGGNPYQSSFTADTGTYRLCADKVYVKGCMRSRGYY